MPLYPLRPSEMMSGRDQLPSEEAREKLIAHNIMNTTLQNFNEQNFVAFVNRDKLFNVAYEIVKFLNKGEEFMSY